MKALSDTDQDLIADAIIGAGTRVAAAVAEVGGLTVDETAVVLARTIDAIRETVAAYLLERLRPH